MFLLYLDDSGSARNVNEQYLVLGGICVFEPQIIYFTKELDALAQTINPSNPDSIEFHASAIYAGRCAPWSTMSRSERSGILKRVLTIVQQSYVSARAFACAVHKNSYPNQDPMEIAFEDLCSRFDKFLQRSRDEGDVQRGMIVLDDSAYETTLQVMAREFRRLGTRWDAIRNIAEVPLFVNSTASRCVQIADHIAYAVFRRYESGDTSYLDIFSSRFDSAGGILHGLSHKHPSASNCMCLACMSRRSSVGSRTI